MTRRVGYDETVGVFEQPGLSHPIALYISHRADRGAREQTHLSYDDARWLVGELLRHLRNEIGVGTADLGVIVGELDQLAEEFVQLRRRLLAIAAPLRDPTMRREPENDTIAKYPA